MRGSGHCGVLPNQVFFRAEGGEAAAVNGISGTHMLLWLPHFHDFCLTVRAPYNCPAASWACLEHAFSGLTPGTQLSASSGIINWSWRTLGCGTHNAGNKPAFCGLVAVGMAGGALLHAPSCKKPIRKLR